MPAPPERSETECEMPGKLGTHARVICFRVDKNRMIVRLPAARRSGLTWTLFLVACRYLIYYHFLFALSL